VPPWPCTTNACSQHRRSHAALAQIHCAPPRWLAPPLRCPRERDAGRRPSHHGANATQAGGHRITRSQSAGKARISLLLVATRLDARRDLGQHAAGRGVVARVGDGAHRAVDEGLEAQKLQGHGALPISARGSSAASAHPAARAPTWNICRNTEIALVRGLLAGKTLAETNDPRGFYAHLGASRSLNWGGRPSVRRQRSGHGLAWSELGQP